MTDSELVLKVESAKLGEFIFSLLGQQRRIEKSFEGGQFIAKHEWVLNLIDVFEQRMSQHTHYSMASFRCRFYFDDSSIYTLETLDAFRAYTDISSRESLVDRI